MADEKLEQGDLFEFNRPVIKGCPELRWTGKRPFSATQFFPAQLKEKYGEADETGWINKIFWGDNLQVMSHLLREFRGKVDLVYIDPPFDSKADYKKKIELRGKKISSDSSAFEEKQYGDIWSNDEYLQFMYERLILLRELLSDKGSIYLHCDWRKVHHLRCLMDEVFGPQNFRACITWRAMTSSGYKGKSSMGRSHADILYYSKSADFTYNPFYLPLSDEMLARYSHVDPDGRRFKDSNLGDVTDATLKELEAKNLVYWTSNHTPRIKHYLDEAQGVIADDVWTDINVTNSQSNLNTGYPTQKPEALLERIIRISSNPGDLVFDCFMGSGTTQNVALQTGRRFLGADINLGSIQTTTSRLLTTMEKSGLLSACAGFEVYNVNNYDFFRNPVEAHELIIEALGIQKFGSNSAFDGELDGRNVKILPINRIGTKADLAELIANLPYKAYEKAKEENPNDPVDRITLICMGHEPDLAAGFQQMVGTYKIDVEIVDILRDKSALELKRDSQAEVVLKHGDVVIKQFFPMNLMQKLSLQKENVDDWKQLVDSIMIDYNYDGSTLNPQIIDIPEKDGFVKGKYSIPKEHGKIRIKITDLLSESLEIEVSEDA